MQFREVDGMIEANKSLIGETFNGAVIDELICIPIGYEAEYKNFYLQTLDAKQALALLIKSIGVFPIDTVDAMTHCLSSPETEHYKSAYTFRGKALIKIGKKKEGKKDLETANSL